MSLLPPDPGLSQRGAFRPTPRSFLLAGPVEWPLVAHLQGLEGGDVSPSLGEGPVGLLAERLGEAGSPTPLPQ